MPIFISTFEGNAKFRNKPPSNKSPPKRYYSIHDSGKNPDMFLVCHFISFLIDMVASQTLLSACGPEKWCFVILIKGTASITIKKLKSHPNKAKVFW